MWLWCQSMAIDSFYSFIHFTCLVHRFAFYYPSVFAKELFFDHLCVCDSIHSLDCIIVGVVPGRARFNAPPCVTVLIYLERKVNSEWATSYTIRGKNRVVTIRKWNSGSYIIYSPIPSTYIHCVSTIHRKFSKTDQFNHSYCSVVFFC